MATIVCHTQGTVIEGRGERLRFLTPDGVSRDIPLIQVDRLHCYGKIQVTTNAIHLLAGAGRDLVWFSRTGRLRARLVHNPAHGIELRRAQYRLADDPGAALAVARRLVAAKVHNQRAVLVRAWRSRAELRDEALLTALDTAIVNCAEATNADSLRGYEGAAAAAYWPAWAALCGPFTWTGRNRRPPRDPLNILLSFGYTLLTNEIHAHCEAIGADPWLGVLHGLRPSRPALALDLMEPFRPILVDRLILDLVGHQRLRPTHFEIPPDPGPRPIDPDTLADPEGLRRDPDTGVMLPRLSSDGFRTFITAYERRMAHRDRDDDDAPAGFRHQVSEAISGFARAVREQQLDTLTPFRLRT